MSSEDHRGLSCGGGPLITGLLTFHHPANEASSPAGGPSLGPVRCRHVEWSVLGSDDTNLPRCDSVGYII